MPAIPINPASSARLATVTSLSKGVRICGRKRKNSILYDCSLRSRIYRDCQAIRHTTRIDSGCNRPIRRGICTSPSRNITSHNICPATHSGVKEPHALTTHGAAPRRGVRRHSTRRRRTAATAQTPRARRTPLHHGPRPAQALAHSHLWQAAFRGLAADSTLTGWLRPLLVHSGRRTRPPPARHHRGLQLRLRRRQRLRITDVGDHEKHSSVRRRLVFVPR